jgi:Ni/Fe-hydrogenase subunit HybB-like protein
MSNRARGLKDLLWALALAGLVAGVLRLWFGLGATTSLSDAVPWGLWKVLNMVAGVAVSTSGFTVGFLVYVLRIERFRPLMKPAILVAFLGYGCSCLALLFDIGLPHRFWHPLVMWNHHSFLFEVFWCVTLYFTVTAVELAPVIFERLRAERTVRFLHKVAFGVVVAGISLSSLHHSSLGSLFLVTPQRLHALWYTPLLPLLFIVSAIGTGLMFVVLVRILYARWYDRDSVFGPAAPARELIKLSDVEPRDHPEPARGPDMPMLSRVAAIAGGVLGLYLVLQIVNLVVTGAWRALVAGTWESWLFALELLISAVLPVLLVALPRTRRSPYGLGIAAFSATAGLALNRLNVGIFGYFRDAGAVYFPSLAEWALSIGVVAAAGLAFLFVVENFAVFGDRREDRRVSPGMFRASFDSLSRVSKAALSGGVERTTLIAVLVVPLAWAAMYPPYAHPADPLVRPASGLDVLRTTLRIDGDQRGVWTEFPHADHQERLGGEEACRTCHHMALPEDQSTPCSRCHQQMVRPTLIFDHAYHRTAVAERELLGGLYPANHACAECHTAGDAKTAASAKHCLECHEKDTQWAREYDHTAVLTRAVSYLDAMHENCIPCHEEEGAIQGRDTLGDCATCHPSLKPKTRDGTQFLPSQASRCSGGRPTAETGYCP